MLPADHSLADRDVVLLHEVADEPAILLDVPPTIERVVGMMRSAVMEPKLQWQSTNMETIRSLVARGLGFSVVNSPPESNTTFDNRTVTYVPLSDHLPKNTITCALPPKVRPPRKVTEAIRFCQTQAAH
ncbi:LysR substrate-binding domain-containing protein [Arthrobacter castelli]|uniref:LysR substrate-binding domain-containing protein n=1 Tax=Arthrobacter castelli TaxID=271431 RepID=UPI000421070B